MQGIGTFFGKQAVCRDHLGNGGRLHRNDGIFKIKFFKQGCVIQRTLAQCFCGGCAVFLQNVFFKRTAVDTDADRDVFDTTSIADRLDTVIVTDIAGVNANFIVTKLGTTQRDLVVKMNIRNDRDGESCLLDADNRIRRLHGGNGNAHDVTSRILKRTHLRNRRLGIQGIGVGHGLDGDGVIAADRQAADFHFSAFSSYLVILHNAIISLIAMITANESSMTSPTKLIIPSTSFFTGFRRMISMR